MCVGLPAAVRPKMRQLGAVLVIRVVLDDLTRGDGFANLANSDDSSQRLIECVTGKLELVSRNLASDFINQCHQPPSFSGLSPSSSGKTNSPFLRISRSSNQISPP